MTMRFALALTAGFMLLPAMAGAQTAAAPSAYPYDKAPWWMKESVITQTGFVFSEVPANRASFSGTFLTVDTSAQKAQAKAIEQTRALQEALGRLGKDKVRVTTSFSMRALYEQYRDKNGNRIEDERGDKINGYEVALEISVEVRDLSQLEKAYALVLAASPTSAQNIAFSLQPTNEMNTWLYNEAVKDARKRAADAAVSAGGTLGKIKVIDPTGRACETDILARQAPDTHDGITANDIGAFPDKSITETLQRVPGVTVTGFRSNAGTAEYLEEQAIANPFIQTPPLRKLTAKACVVYGLD